MAFKPIDPKRDEFRRYLENNGVIEALTKAFVRLVKERPDNPMEVLLSNLGDSKLRSDHEAILKRELGEARTEIERLRARILAIDPTAFDNEKEVGSSHTNEHRDYTELEPRENVKVEENKEVDFSDEESDGGAAGYTAERWEEQQEVHFQPSTEEGNFELVTEMKCLDLRAERNPTVSESKEDYRVPGETQYGDTCGQ